MDCSLPGSSIHGIFQTRILEWVAISFSKESSQARDETRVSGTAGRHLTVQAPREASGYTLLQITQINDRTHCRADATIQRLVIPYNGKDPEKGQTHAAEPRAVLSAPS